MATDRAQELDRLYQMRNPPRRGHAPQISISDDNHHVTEAIGDLYGGDSDTESNRRSLRPLSFVPSPNGDSIQSFGAFEAFDPFPNAPPARSPLRPQLSSDHPATPASPYNGSDAPQNKVAVGRDSSNGDHMSPPLSRSNSGTASHQFPLNDLDYESSPAGLAQELSNLQAIRRMSMGVNSADPDLPSFQSANSPPSPPAVSEEDESKLFWVPARLHPELAPMEFKTFIEDKIDKTRRRSGDSDSLNPDAALGRQGSGAGLRRKKSMLSRQIDTGSGYKDGAERLERKRSGATRPNGGLDNLQELENIQEDPVALIRRMSIDHKTFGGEGDMGDDGDLPIVPGSKMGGLGTLKRSTRTTYRRGSIRKGGPALSRRLVSGRQAETDTEDSPSTSPIQSTESIPEVPPLPLSRTHSEPVNSAFEGSSSNFSRPPPPNRTTSNIERPGSAEEAPSSASPEQKSSPQPRRFHSRIASNGRTTAPLPGYVPPQQQVPQIIETSPQQDQRQLQLPERSSSRQLPPPSQQQPAGPRSYPQPQQPPSNQQRQPPAGRQNRHAQAAQASPIKPSQSMDDLVGHGSPMPGTSNRVDSLSIIPNAPDDRKLEKKSKDKKDSSEGPRKTSWGWFGGDKEKEKDKNEKDKDKDTAKKTKNKLSKPQEKGHDDTRLDLLQTSIQGGGRGRESVVLDRESVKLEEERKKESAKKTAGDGKKEKEHGLLSSIFGGGKKKGEKESSHKKNVSRGLSPDPPVRILKPDIDYNWTRFSILEERAIYRMAHIKLANPRRELYSQVLLSNFMYSYLAKVQQMHPQISIGNSKQAKQAQQAQQAQQAAQQKKEQQLQQQQQQLQMQQQQVAQQPQQAPQQQQQAQPEEFAQYQRYQQQQQQQQQQQYEQQEKTQEWPSVYQQQENGFSQQPQQNGNHQKSASQGASHNQNPRDSHHSNYSANGGGSGGGGSGGYSVANAQNYLGQPNNGSYSHHAESGQGAKTADDDMW